MPVANDCHDSQTDPWMKKIFWLRVADFLWVMSKVK